MCVCVCVCVCLSVCVCLAGPSRWPQVSCRATFEQFVGAGESRVSNSCQSSTPRSGISTHCSTIHLQSVSFCVCLSVCISVCQSVSLSSLHLNAVYCFVANKLAKDTVITWPSFTKQSTVQHAAVDYLPCRRRNLITSHSRQRLASLSKRTCFLLSLDWNWLVRYLTISQWMLTAISGIFDYSSIDVRHVTDDILSLVISLHHHLNTVHCSTAAS